MVTTEIVGPLRNKWRTLNDSPQICRQGQGWQATGSSEFYNKLDIHLNNNYNSVKICLVDGEEKSHKTRTSK